MTVTELLICVFFTVFAFLLLYGVNRSTAKNAEIAKKEGWIWCERKYIWNGLIPTFTKYILLGNKLIIRRNFITYREEEVLLYRMRDFSLKQTLIQRILGVATITVKSADETMHDFMIENIKGSHQELVDIKNQLSQLADAERIKHRQVELGHMSLSNDADGDGIPDIADTNVDIPDKL